jgi:hypothetical protein
MLLVTTAANQMAGSLGVETSPAPDEDEWSTAGAIQYGKQWGDVYVSLADPIVQGQADLSALGWEVRVLDGLDHMQAMQASQVAPILRSWLMSQQSAVHNLQ